VRRLQSADLGDRWHNHAGQQAAADGLVLGGVFDGDGLFSNLKRWALGVYHGLRRTNLQHYLDEFVFRFNRRRTRHAAFETLLGIGARTSQAPYCVLIRKAA
jgi:hypothetical protein